MYGLSLYVLVFLIYYAIWLAQLHGRVEANDYRIFFLHFNMEIIIQAGSKVELLSVFHLYSTGPFTNYTYSQNYDNYHLEEVKFTEVQSWDSIPMKFK